MRSLIISVSLVLSLSACSNAPPPPRVEHPYSIVAREMQSTDPVIRDRAIARARVLTRSPPQYVESSNPTTFITPLGDGMYQTSRGGLIIVQ